MCTTFPGCLTSVHGRRHFGTIAHHGAKVTRDIDTRGAPRSRPARRRRRGRVGRFELDAAADVRLDFTQAPGRAHAVGLFRAGANQACDRNPVNCLNVVDAATATRTYPALPPGVYWLIVQSYPTGPARRR